MYEKPKTFLLRSPMKLARVSALAALFLITAGVIFTAYAQLPAPQTENGVQYVSGGIGKDESDAFKAAKSQYPLAMTFAATSPGSSSTPYVAQIQVEIKDESGKTVLNLPSVGPYLLVDLEPGHYEISATYEGDTQTHEVTVVGDGSADLRYTWQRPATGSD